jgi:hypothetical protein
MNYVYYKNLMKSRKMAVTRVSRVIARVTAMISLAEIMARGPARREVKRM